MNIREWVSKQPIGERGKAVSKVADACGVAHHTARAWVKGARGIKPMYWEAIVHVTDGEVSIVDLLTSSRREAA